jgi:hypothetical protein
MRKELDAIATSPEQKAYLQEIRRRDRRATWATRCRYVLIHLSWIIVLLAGAAVALVDVFDLSSRFAALLGFVVVVFQGIERVFDRTSVGSRSMDLLRRGLAREQRLMLVRGGPYASAEDPIELFAERCEQLLSENDDAMVDYFAKLADQAGS